MNNLINFPAPHVIDEVARVFRARRTAAGRYLAMCPACPGRVRAPSLSIYEDSDGRILFFCLLGCRTTAVLAAAGLSMSDLVAGPKPSPEEEAALAREQDERDAARWGQSYDWGMARIRELQDLSATLDAKLARMADGPGADNLKEERDRSLNEAWRLEQLLPELKKFASV